MTKGLLRSLERGDILRQLVVKSDEGVQTASFTITDVAVQPGWGTVVLSGLPEGNFVLIGAVAYLEFTKGDANITDTFSGDAALGTAPTADNTLSGAEVDIIPSTAIGPAVAGVVALTRLANTSTENGNVFDNTDGSLELNLNMLVDDADISANSSMTVRGTIHLAFTMLGDD